MPEALFRIGGAVNFTIPLRAVVSTFAADPTR
jgi:hypothetical protein